MDDFVFLDIESTGLDPSRDRIIEVAGVKWCKGKITDEFSSVVNPNCHLPSEITLLTGITEDDVKHAPLFSDIKEKLTSFIGDEIVVGHNIAFDMAFLKSHHMVLINETIDTLVLAKILLRKEPSYALEVLMKKYGLPCRSSHRALEDVLTTIAFFEFLLKKIAEIPLEVMVKIHRLLMKTTWSGGRLFLKKSHSFAEKISVQFKKSDKEYSLREAQYLDHTLVKSFLAGSKILLESPYIIPLKSLEKIPTIVSYVSQCCRDDLLRQAESEKINAVELKEPHLYISPQKLKNSIDREKISIELVPFLLKILLWESETAHGDREEISIDRDEYNFFEMLGDCEAVDVYWQQALARASTADIVLIHHYALACGIVNRLNDISHKRFSHIIITEAARLEESFTNALKKRYTERSLRTLFGDKATIVFGMLGIFYERFSDPQRMGTFGNVIITEDARSSIEWKRAMDALLHLPDHPDKKKILTNFEAAPNSISWITSFADEVIYTRAPIIFADYFQKSIAEYSHVLIQSSALSGDGTFKFVKNMCEFDSRWKEVKEDTHLHQGNVETIIPKDFPEPFSNGYFKACLKLFSEIIATSKGRALFLLSSKKMVESICAALLPKVKDSKIRLLGVGHSGGTGKSVALFREAPETSVLFSTHQIMPFLQDIEDMLDVVVFQKIPFDPPNDPLLNARARQFEDGFTDYTLPRAIIKFRELLAEFSRGNVKTCYILDSRIHTRDYGTLFLRS